MLPLQHWIPVAPEERVSHPAPIRYALEKAVNETVDMTRFVLVGIVRLIQGRVSLKSLSGPITIFQVAGEEGRARRRHVVVEQLEEESEAAFGAALGPG